MAGYQTGYATRTEVDPLSRQGLNSRTDSSCSPTSCAMPRARPKLR